MTSIGSSLFSTSQISGAKAPTQKMTQEEMEKFKKLQESLFSTAADTGVAQQPSQTQSTATTAFTAATSSTKITDDAVQRERSSVEGRVATPQTQIAAQSLGASDKTDSGLDTSAGESVEDQFLDFANGSWQDRFEDMMLKSMGLTKEDLQNMSPADREKVMAKIREKIKEEVEKKTGVQAGSTAAAAATPDTVAV